MNRTDADFALNTPAEIQRTTDFVLGHPFHRFAGLRLVEQQPGRAVARFQVAGDVLNHAGTLHAGLLYGLMDATAFLALVTVLRPGESAATHDLHVSVMRPALRGEEIEIRAEVLKRGGSVAFIRCEAWRIGAAEPLLAATGTVTKSLSMRK
jgi:uncharacterized protein (TIGR00369 family)